jgi:peroxiredoxin
MTLSSELEALRLGFFNKAPPEIRDAILRADLALAASGLADRAIKAGDPAPDFALPDMDGRTVRLSTVLGSGPIVVSFYRGGWCPYCNLELRALQRLLPAFEALGARLLAISPQTPDQSLTTAQRNALSFTVLSDAGSAVARAFGIAFDLAEELRPLYARLGHALPVMNGDESWVLPAPATFVIDRDGTIALAFVDTDYRNRLEPADILAALKTLSLIPAT